jgi:hypothetical protein
MERNTSDLELAERVKLIEDMLAAGRRKTESWGWTFVLWGVAYYVAIAWATWGQGLGVWSSNHSHPLAWPVTMVAACVLTMAIGMRKGRGEPGTTMSRAIVSVWICSGIAMLVLFPALSLSGRNDAHMFVAVVAAMLGVANGASGAILKWKMQLACAAVWWITSGAALFGTDAQLAMVFLAAIFLCQIVFGIYAMVLESRRRRESGVAHA